MEGIQTALFIGWTAFDQELVPLDNRGRWSGLTMLAHGIIGVIAPIMGGMIWNLNPDYIWWINLIGDAFIVLPLMIMIPNINREIAQKKINNSATLAVQYLNPNCAFAPQPRSQPILTYSKTNRIFMKRDLEC